MTELIKLEDVSFFSEDYEVIKTMDVAIPKNKCSIILGPSGCGKSTFLKVAAGIYPPDTGRVLVESEDLFNYSYKKMKKFRQNAGFVFEDSALWSNRTIFQNLALPLEFHFKKISKEQVKKRVYGLLDKVGYSPQANLRPAQLSSSERKAVAFLRAIVTEPQILFMDEPVQSLDHQTAEVIVDIIKKMKTNQCSLLMVTNSTELTSRLADYLVLIKEGALVEAGNFEKIKNTTNPVSREILKLILGQAASFDTDILDLLQG